MMTLIADEWMSLDGIVQSPTAPDEDPSGGFAHGGWHVRYFDETAQAWILDGLTAADAFLFGRGTYEQFAAHWPKAGDEEQVVAQPLNSKPKYVVSSTLTESPSWAGTTAIGLDELASLKQREDGELHLIGSAGLARTLIAAGLVDRLRLMIDPVLLGGGKSLFPTSGELQAWRLVSSVPTTTGALLATYDKA
jgi:dihydrofolate reductase